MARLSRWTRRAARLRECSLISRRHLSTCNADFMEHPTSCPSWFVVDGPLKSRSPRQTFQFLQVSAIKNRYRGCSPPRGYAVICVSHFCTSFVAGEIESFVPGRLPKNFPPTTRARKTRRNNVALRPNLSWQRDIDRIVSN